ncbi:MAG: DUF4251 domain-containing protein [Tannerellaceae bacterium]|nr:DUF4251 domain-containing protein [Tannerellaceae bacterium]
MKRLRLLLVLGFALFIGGHSLFAQSKDKKEQIREQVKELIDSREYTIDVDRAYPSSGKSVNLTSPYELRIKGDSVISYLPYFGRAYSVPYGGGEGLRFETGITDYSLAYDKKGAARIQFKAKTQEDSFTFNIQVFDNGSSSITVTPVNRQQIRFNGELKRQE